MKVLNAMVGLSVLVAKIIRTIDAANPALFGINSTVSNGTVSADETYYPCDNTGYSLMNSCERVALNNTLLEALLLDADNNTSFDILNNLPLFGNLSVQFVSHSTRDLINEQAQANDASNFIPYDLLEFKSSDNQQGQIIIDGDKVLVTLSGNPNMIIIQPCPIQNDANSCYVAVNLDVKHIEDIDRNEHPMPHRLLTAKSSRALESTNLASKISNAAATDPSILTLSFAYDPQVAATIGLENLRIRSLGLVEIINQVLKNSQIDNILQVRLQEAFVYTGVTDVGAGTSLNYFSGSDRKGAHIAALVQANLNVCGMAFEYCAQYSGYMLTICPYLILNYGCLEYSVAHEWGHVLGLDHDPENAFASPFAFGKGYINSTKKIRTVMSYPYLDTVRILYYSSNSVKTPEGNILGNDNQNNRQVLIQTARATVSKLTTIIPVTPAPTPPLTVMCSGTQKVRKKLLFSATALAANATNPTQQNIRFQLDKTGVNSNAYLRLKLFRNDAAPLLISFGKTNVLKNNPHEFVQLKASDKVTIAFDTIKHASIKLSNSKNLLKSSHEFSSPSTFTGQTVFAGSGISRLTKVQCYAP